MPNRWLPSPRTLHALGLLLVLAGVLAAPLIPEPLPDCCCGDVCYMACARGQDGADEHLQEDGAGSSEAWIPLSRCASDCPGVASVFSAHALALLAEPSRLQFLDGSRASFLWLCAQGGHPLDLSASSPRGPPSLS